MLVLRATLKQNRHEFTDALKDLSRALSAQPRNAQAWLTRATLLQVRGEYAEAGRSCLPLVRLADALVAVTCMSSAAGLNGQARKSYEALKSALEVSPDAGPEERLWALTVLAEAAARLGDAEAAERHFREALSIGRRDAYLLAAYADFLLDRGREDEVIALLRQETRADGLLLRLALAEQRLQSPELASHVALLDACFAASRARADTVHQGEEARFTLHLLKEPARALALAASNWAVQREPRDARVLLEAALAARQPAAARPVVAALKQSRLEDVQLSRLISQLQASLSEMGQSETGQSEETGP